MKKIFSIANIYVVLWVVYYTQGTIIAQGSMISRLVLVLYLMISLYYCVVANVKYIRGPYIKSLDVLLLMFTVYGVVNVIQGGSVNYIKNIYLSLMPIYTFYVFKLRGKIDEMWIKRSFVVMVGVVLVQFVSYQLFLEETLREAEYATINVGYDILALLPIIYLFKERPIVQYVLMGAFFVLLLSTVKRGAIVVGVICLLYFIYNTLKKSKKKTKWYVWLIVIAFIIAGVRYAFVFYANSEFAQMRMDATLEGNSSGRDVIYSRAWAIFTQSNFFNLLLGHGADGTLELMGVRAHNDWLELLVNQGLLGAIIYLFYWKSLHKTYKYYTDKESKPVLGMFIIIYFLATLFSMSYYAITLPASVALGYCLGKDRESRAQAVYLKPKEEVS